MKSELKQVKNQTNDFSESIIRIRKEHARLQSLEYFADLARQWYENIVNGKTRTRTVILGTGVPEELVMAIDASPLRILGGSHESCMWSDDFVPRDTDPVSRSLLGFVRMLQQNDQEHEILYIIPSNSDSLRKIAYQLMRDGEKVHVLDVPPSKADELSFGQWKKSLSGMMEAIEQHCRKWASSASIHKSIRNAVRARTALHRFVIMSAGQEDILSPAVRILVQNSYSFAADLSEWTKHMHELMYEMLMLNKGRQANHKNNPGVLLVGSPIYFPNLKLPYLLDESGLNIIRQMDAFENIRLIKPKISKIHRNYRKMIDAVARAWYKADASTAYLKNEAMRVRIRKMCESQMVEGVVFHILKGQIEQDFELPWCEEMLEEYGIPLFRLETDYQYQDVEQLRIRMEAFSELLHQNRFLEKEAV